MRDYWKRVGYRAYSETTALLGVDSREKIVIKGIFVVAIILALALFGSKDASTDEMIVRFTIIAVFVLLILLVYAWKFVDSPPRIESEAAAEANAKISSLQERITALEDERQQILTFEFRPEDNKYLEVVRDTYASRIREFKVGRVAVKNLSHAKMVQGLRLTLVHYWEDKAPIYNTVDVLLTSYSSAGTVEDVGPRRNLTCNLFRVRNKDQLSNFEFGPYPDGLYKQVSIGKYRLKITASSADTPSISQFFLLDVKANGEIMYRPWRKAETTHVMTRPS